jgi:Domain of unknown function (DUF4349)
MTRRFPVALFLPLLAIGCESQFRSDQSGDAAGYAVSAPANRATDEAVTPPTPTSLSITKISAPGTILRDSVSLSMIIRTGNAFIEVDSLESAIAQIRSLAERAGGYIANSAIQTGEGQQRQATLEIKVPSTRYNEAVGGLSGIGKLISSSTNAQDVGEEFVDMTARMTNARRMEERLVNLLATRTGKLEDVLAVERELARVREEIERYEGRLRFLRTQVAMSTLSVTVSEPAPVVGNPGSNVVVEAFKQAWRNFVLVIAGGIEMFGAVLPLIVLGVVGWITFRRRRARQVTQAS